MYLHLDIAFYRIPSWTCLLITISISAPAEQTQNAEEGAPAAPADQPDNAAAEPEATAADPAKDEEAVDITNQEKQEETNPAADGETADAAAPGNYHLRL